MATLARPYVVVPLPKYQALMKAEMEKESRQKTNPTETAETKANPNESNSSLDQKQESVKLYKRAKFEQMKTLLRQKGIHFDNLDELIKHALGNSSKRSMANIVQFYDQLFQTNLGHLVHNSSAIKHFKPDWFEVYH